MLVERVEDGLATGTNRELKVCRFPSQDATLVGKFLPVRAKLAKSWILEVELVEKKPTQDGVDRVSAGRRG